MNRLIKFRVWDDYYKIMRYHGDGCAGDIVVPIYENSGHEKFQVMQSTGYLDKNKNPIFEGDIVRTDAKHITYCLGGAPLYTKGEVKFVNAGFNVCQSHIGRTHFEDFVTCGCCPCGLEIIGNIFENKDLCEK
jgi:uncharacterized phage protein (TIGR01671 family)